MGEIKRNQRFFNKFEARLNSNKHERLISNLYKHVLFYSRYLFDMLFIKSVVYADFLNPYNFANYAWFAFFQFASLKFLITAVSRSQQKLKHLDKIKQYSRKNFFLLHKLFLLLG